MKLCLLYWPTEKNDINSKPLQDKNYIISLTRDILYTSQQTANHVTIIEKMYTLQCYYSVVAVSMHYHTNAQTDLYLSHQIWVV